MNIYTQSFSEWGSNISLFVEEGNVRGDPISDDGKLYSIWMKFTGEQEKNISANMFATRLLLSSDFVLALKY